MYVCIRVYIYICICIPTCIYTCKCVNIYGAWMWPKPRKS